MRSSVCYENVQSLGSVHKCRHILNLTVYPSHLPCHHITKEQLIRNVVRFDQNINENFLRISALVYKNRVYEGEIEILQVVV